MSIAKLLSVIFKAWGKKVAERSTDSRCAAHCRIHRNDSLGSMVLTSKYRPASVLHVPYTLGLQTRVFMEVTNYSPSTGADDAQHYDPAFDSVLYTLSRRQEWRELLSMILKGKWR